MVGRIRNRSAIYGRREALMVSATLSLASRHLAPSPAARADDPA